jgi:hypothetical protein
MKEKIKPKRSKGKKTYRKGQLKLFLFLFAVLLASAILRVEANVINNNSNCYKISKDQGDIKLFFWSDKYKESSTIKFAGMITNKIQREKVFRNKDYEIYFERNQGDCKSIKQSAKDIEIGISDLSDKYVSGVGAKGNNKHASFIVLDYRYKLNSFVLFHELGHAYGLGHTNEKNNYMSLESAKNKYTKEQREKIIYGLTKT